MEAEGLVLRETARRMLRIGKRQLQERVSDWALVPVARQVVDCRGGRWGLWTVQGYGRGEVEGLIWPINEARMLARNPIPAGAA